MGASTYATAEYYSITTSITNEVIGCGALDEDTGFIAVAEVDGDAKYIKAFQ